MFRDIAAAPIFALIWAAPAWAEKHVEVHLPGIHVEVHKDKERDDKGLAQVRGEYPFQLVRASSLVGQRVTSAKGDEMGTIQELAFDATERRIACAVVDFGRYVGAAEKLYAVPWQALSDPTPEDRG